MSSCMQTLAFCLAIALSVSPSTAAAPTSDQFQGRITAVSPNSIMVLDKQGTMTDFLVGADCTIVRNGKPAKVADLAVGDVAVVTAITETGRHVAKSIMARSQE